MWFWWFMFVCNLIVPFTMLISGRMMWKHPPKSINGLIGYRTSRSMKNMETWRFAHDYCGRLWWKVGWVMLIVSNAAYLPCYHQSENVVGIVAGILCTIQCIVLVVSIIPTERALKKFIEAQLC